MGDFKDFFGGLFGRPGKENARAPGADRRPAERPRPALDAEHRPGVPYKKGDIIGQKYEVYGHLGRGGFGVVYLVYSRETKSVYALKTFRDEYFEDAEIRERFRREASVWVELERHPYLVRAYLVDEVAGRLYIGMEYIAPDEQGLNSLEGYLQRQPPGLAQSLRWAVQFCYGMEHVYSRGVRAHRDIKPGNIMIGQDKTVKITDFGLAGALGSAKATPGIRLNIQEGRVGLSGQTMEGVGFGTPTHMPPEQFTKAAGCDEKSDIYAFGIVLYQMAAGGKLPFLPPLPRDNSAEEMARFWRAMHRLHSESPVPRLDSPLFPIIQRCLEKEPNRRYHNFKELRSDLEPFLRRETGEVITPPELKQPEVWEWSNKGSSFASLGRFEEAVLCYEKALELDPRYAAPWIGKGNSLCSLGRSEEAIRCYDIAIGLDPLDARAWNNRGNSLASLGRFEEAIRCYDRALELDPRIATAWLVKAAVEEGLGRRRDAARSYKQFIALAPAQYREQIECARQRLRELEGR